MFQLHEGQHNNDPGDGGHEEAEDDIPSGLDTSFARGEPSRVDFFDSPIADNEGDVGQGIENGIGHGGEQGERTACRYGGIAL